MGFQEWMVIAVVALIVVGPTRLPTVARFVGQLAGRLRVEAAAAMASLKSEVDLSELSELGSDFNDLRQEFRETKRIATQSMRDLALGDAVSGTNNGGAPEEDGSNAGPKASDAEKAASATDDASLLLTSNLTEAEGRTGDE
jgi:Tat protein translocase TatB subunit